MAIKCPQNRPCRHGLRACYNIILIYICVRPAKSSLDRGEWAIKSTRVLLPPKRNTFSEEAKKIGAVLLLVDASNEGGGSHSQLGVDIWNLVVNQFPDWTMEAAAARRRLHSSSARDVMHSAE